MHSVCLFVSYVTVAKQNCLFLKHICLFCCLGYVTRQCMENGEWYFHPMRNRTWSNYSGCVSNSSDRLHVPELIQVNTIQCDGFCFKFAYKIHLVFLFIRCYNLCWVYRKLGCISLWATSETFMSTTIFSIIWELKNIISIQDITFSIDILKESEFPK